MSGEAHFLALNFDTRISYWSRQVVWVRCLTCREVWLNPLSLWFRWKILQAFCITNHNCLGQCKAENSATVQKVQDPSRSVCLQICVKICYFTVKVSTNSGCCCFTSLTHRLFQRYSASVAKLLSCAMENVDVFCSRNVTSTSLH